MLRTAANIIKSSDVKVEGEFQLDIDLPTKLPPQCTDQPATTPKVHIVENHPEYALIEFTCACGNKYTIKCQYDQTESAANQTQ
ncbi:MAG: hypothetical protein ACYS8Z_19805 [Planctomycetota bacterium]|jgi:hypothetical protein